MQCCSGFSAAKCSDSIPARVNAHHFAGLDIAHVCGADQIESAGFRRHDPGAVELAERERAETARVAQRVHFVARQHQQRIRALHLIEGIGERAGKIARLAARHQVHDHFGVARRLENRAAMFERAAPFRRARQIAVVPQSELSLVAVDDDGCAFVSEVSPAVE